MFCRLEANAGALTNFEVLDFLKSKGASKDPTRVIAPVAPSEYKVRFYFCTDCPSCVFYWIGVVVISDGLIVLIVL